MNLWETPLVKIDNYFILILMPVCEPVLCRMVDVWLQKGGIPLDKRGHKFELYVKEVLNRILKAKGISFCILNINKFKNRNNEFEEIDLLIELEDKIIIGEVKCILYPMTNRDYYNSFETLKKGCKQLIRKTDFLLRNKKLFSKSIKNIDESNIIKMVITNFPIYSGQSYKGVPIVDIHLLEKYFLKGKHIELEFDSNKKTNIEKIAKIYYNNNTEMVANLNSFINSPKLIQYFYNKIEINTSKLTPLGFGYDIFIQDPYFKE